MGLIISNKRGMVFTLLSIAIVSLFLISYGFYNITEDRKSVNDRITTMNNFVFSVEENLVRQLFISGFRMIFLLEKNIIEEGNYIVNINESFDELFYNGSLYQINEVLMDGVTFSGIVGVINEKAKESNVNVSLTNPILTISQETPWNVKFILTTNLFVTDVNNLAYWNKTLTTIAYVPITNFEDPFYIVNTNGLVFNNFNKSKNESFVQGTDVSNLLDHVTNSYYISSTSGPSFLDRLEGNNIASVNGIESLVYLPDLVTQGIPIESKSVVDYIYFSSDNPTSFGVVGMPSWFRIDDEHVDIYGVGNLTV